MYIWKSLSHVQLFETPWTIVCQAPLSLGILQARILEWVVVPFYRVSSQPRDRTQVSQIAGGVFNVWAKKAYIHMHTHTRTHVWGYSAHLSACCQGGDGTQWDLTPSPTAVPVFFSWLWPFLEFSLRGYLDSIQMPVLLQCFAIAFFF